MKLRLLVVENRKEVLEAMQKEIDERLEKDRFIESLESDISNDFADGISKLLSADYDILLMNLNPPGAEDEDAIETVIETIPGIPVLILADKKQEEAAFAEIGRGAEDYILLSDLGKGFLLRSIRYAVKISSLAEEAERRTVIDELTGLYNRRGFFTLGGQALNLAKRNGRRFAVIYCELRHLRDINSQNGMEAGDKLIKCGAEFLDELFRKSDIVARIGNDEFGIIAHEQSDASVKSLKNRFNEALSEYKQESENSDLNFRIGIVCCGSKEDESLDDLLVHAESFARDRKGEKEITAI